MRLAPIAIALFVLAAPAGASAASVDLLVVGKTRVLREAAPVKLRARSVRVGGRRCAVGRATPLSVLAGSRLALRLRDYGSCGRSPADAGSLYVRKVGPDRAGGPRGWVYKIGRRAGTTGAADPSGPFGTGKRLRGGRLLWFWCVQNRANGCQRTLEARPETSTVAPGAPLRVTVRGYDDNGRGVPVAGALVRLGGAQALTGADGVATVAAPAAAGVARATAELDGMVRSFPERVTVG
ncbi:MAG: hypothetical protein QOD44_2911 [Solirubrobacteraceae bacterium]|nr:hypothetical protein [Solirubrobacteraceae bacterium]